MASFVVGDLRKQLQNKSRVDTTVMEVCGPNSGGKSASDIGLPIFLQNLQESLAISYLKHPILSTQMGSDKHCHEKAILTAACVGHCPFQTKATGLTSTQSIRVVPAIMCLTGRQNGIVAKGICNLPTRMASGPKN